jgi:hypothetical protein
MHELFENEKTQLLETHEKEKQELRTELEAMK